MRIAMVVNSYPPRLGGLEYHIESLAHGLTALGHDVRVLTIAAPTGVRDDDGVRVLTGRSYLPIAEVITFPALGATRAIGRYLRAHRVDVVSTHTRFFPMSLVGLRAAHAAGLPVIHTEHGSGFVAIPSPLISLGSRAVDLTMGRYVLRHAEKVLGVSPEAARFAESLGASHADVFYNAISAPTDGSPVIDRPSHLVFVGRMVAGKGWDVFLEAVARVRPRYPEISAEMLGAGADLEEARALARRLRIDDIVAIPGRVSQATVRAALRGATLVNPTVLSEGFQTTLLEAVAERGRVITFDVPGATLLQDQGAPVTVCRERSAAGLARALTAAIDAPAPLAPAELIEAWTWPVRAREYAQIAQTTLAEYRAASHQ